jgi:hypothetical protein
VILPASYANGFAPRDGQPLYPELWRGCVGAWNPGLGPTGLTLRDWSGRGNHGTLTNGAAFTARAVTFDGVNDVVSAYSPPSSTAVPFTIFSTVTPTSFSGQKNIASTWQYNVAGGWQLIVEASTGKIGIFFLTPASGGYYGAVSTASITLNKTSTVCVAYSGSSTVAGIKIFINGVESTTTDPTGASGLITFDSTSLWVGLRQNGTGDSPFAGQIHDLRINNAYAPSLCQLYNSRPGIAYEMAPRRRSSSAVQFNRRRRLLIGASS